MEYDGSPAHRLQLSERGLERARLADRLSIEARNLVGADDDIAWPSHGDRACLGCREADRGIARRFARQWSLVDM
jgi:hypothetical protein